MESIVEKNVTCIFAPPTTCFPLLFSPALSQFRLNINQVRGGERELMRKTKKKNNKGKKNKD